MEVKAVTKYVRISPNKARLVSDLVKGKPVEEALNILKFVPKKGARLVSKTLRYIKRIFIDEGPSMKRWRARAMGRATRILKRSSHITIILDEA